MPFVPSPLCLCQLQLCQGHSAGDKDSGDLSGTSRGQQRQHLGTGSSVRNPVDVPRANREISAMGRGNRLELPPGGGGGGWNSPSIRSCPPGARGRCGVTAGPSKGTSDNERVWPGSMARISSGRDQIPTGMLEEAVERLRPWAWCFQRLRGLGGLEEFPLEFQHQQPKAIPQLHLSLGQGLRVPPSRRECLHRAKSAFPPLCCSWKCWEGAGGAPAAAGSTQPFILLAGPAAITAQLTKLPLRSPSLQPLQPLPGELRSPGTGKAGRKGWIPAGAALGCQEWEAGIDPAFSELWELLPQ